MKDILLILTGIFGMFLITFLKDKIFKKAKEKLSKSSAIEKFNINKFLVGMSSITSGKDWAKDISSILNIRKLLIYLTVFGIIYGVGMYRGRMGKPVHFNLEGKEATIKLNDHFLKIEKDGTAKVVDKNGQILKTIKVSDIPELQKALKPFGFQMKPIVVAGLGMGQGGMKPEFGAGVSYFKYYKWNAEAFLTTLGIYPLAISYTLDKLGEGNSAVGIGVGKGWKGDGRVIGYFRWKF